jgi:hypothetical protein
MGLGKTVEFCSMMLAQLDAPSHAAVSGTARRKAATRKPHLQSFNMKK